MGSSTTQTQSATPWAPAADALESGLNDLQSLYKSGGLKINPYAGDWVADPTRRTQAGQAGLIRAAYGARGDYGTAVDALTGVANGNGSRALRRNVIEQVLPYINATFAGSGMTGSSMHQQAVSKGLSSGLADVEMGLQGQRMQAAGMIPGVVDASLNPYREAIGVGRQEQAQQQAEIDAKIQRDLLRQGVDANAIKDYMAIISQLGGQFGSQTATNRNNPGLLGVLGGGLQIASMF